MTKSRAKRGNEICGEEEKIPQKSELLYVAMKFKAKKGNENCGE